MLMVRIAAGTVLFIVSWQIFQALRDHEIRGRNGYSIYKHESPVLFWLAIAACLPLMAVLLFMILFAG